MWHKNVDTSFFRFVIMRAFDGHTDRKACNTMYSVSQKNIPDIFSCNSRKHCRIFIMFGTHGTEKVSNQEML